MGGKIRYYPDKFLSAGGVKARYWDTGTGGETVIFLHGITGAVEQWAYNLPRLEKAHLCGHSMGGMIAPPYYGKIPAAFRLMSLPLLGEYFLRSPKTVESVRGFLT